MTKMAPKAKKAVKKVATMSKQSVSIDMVKEAVMALGDRNGSTIKSILNFLMRNMKVKQSSRTLVILAIGRAVRAGILAKKLPNTFVIRDPSAKTKGVTPMKSRKRKAKRSKKISVKSGKKRRRRNRKRTTLKKVKSRKSMKKRRNRRKAAKKSKARRSRKTKKTTVQSSTTSMSKRPVRRAARGKTYRKYF